MKLITSIIKQEQFGLNIKFEDQVLIEKLK